MNSSNDKGGDEEPKQHNADNTQGGNWKKIFKKALKTDKGLKTVMSILASEEKTWHSLKRSLLQFPPRQVRLK